MKCFLIVLFCLVIVIVMGSLLEISSNDRITLENMAFLRPVYDQCTPQHQHKIDKLVSWHRKYNHPFLVERSVKMTNNNNDNNNDTRFACFIHLGCFDDSNNNMAKWYEFAAIIGVPAALDKRCVEYIKMKANDDMDIIWGLDAAAQKEKIYLEYPQKGLIESFVIQDGHIVQTYRYVKQPVLPKQAAKFSFMYARETDQGEKDSVHLALKTPIETPRGMVYLISQNFKDHTSTLYYRFK